MKASYDVGLAGKNNRKRKCEASGACADAQPGQCLGFSYNNYQAGNNNH